MKHPPSSRLGQRGAALVTALLTVALATMLATQLISAQGEAISQLAGRRDFAQARWLTRGAADWARAILAEDWRTSRIDHLGESWAIKVPPIPINSGGNQDQLEGELGGEIVDLGGCFDLNRLAPSGTVEMPHVAAFTRLLIFNGVRNAEAARLAATLGDWIDRDNETAEGVDERVALGVAPDNMLLAGVGTLLRVPGFTPALLDRLASQLCALPQRQDLNVNTAPAEVLAAELPALGLEGAQRVLNERARTPFRDVADFGARIGALTGTGSIGVSSEFFLVTTRARYGESVAQMRTLLRRTSGGWPDILWQQML